MEPELDLNILKKNLERKKIGDLLVENDLITKADLEQALALQKKQGGRLGEILINQGKMTWESLSLILRDIYKIPYVDLSDEVIDYDAIRVINEAFARKNLVLPMKVNDDTLTIAMAYPDDIRNIQEIRAIAKKRVLVNLAMPKEIERVINIYYKSDTEFEKQINQILIDEELKTSDSQQYDENTPVVNTVNMTIKKGVQSRASDIHFEPQDDILRVRYRIDGILSDMFSLPLSIYPSLLSRIKIMAGMDIAEKRRPQDGKFSIKVDKKEIDIRVATLSTARGERITLRILDKSMNLYGLTGLGLLPEMQTQMEDVLQSSFGMMLIGGPTGSGKTTSLYSCINHLDKNQLNIITIEDPIEYTFSKISQTQVNTKADVTYASGLRAILRSDPDVVLIGEIRDQETARIAVQAALTGHLLLASIHANDAVSIITRLIDLGIDPFLISSTLIAVISQRMARVICNYCKKEKPLTAEEKAIYEEEMKEKAPVGYIGNGCSFCAHTGFLGRTGVFEMLVLTDEIRNAIHKNASHDEIKKIAFSQGMKSLKRDGMMKVKNGLTTVTEIMRCVHTVGL
ncbi:MAG: ATPase, T2SS/T4P/T4SS family [Dehalococcoidales bacterium]|jgi:type IV pilus assembly protein PilB